MKRITIFHYHLLPGGVTDVVTASAISFMNYSDEISSIKIVSGRDDNLKNILEKIKKSIPADRKEDISYEVMPEIDYFEHISNEETSETIKDALYSKFASKDCIWWIHNYHLGKNPLFTKAVLEIAGDGKQKTIFHIHDFPECSRYGMLKLLKEHIHTDLYIEKENIRYVLINKRDFDYMEKGGINRNLLYLLENPIKTINHNVENKKKVISILTNNLGSGFKGWISDKPYILYPVRAIRRKNIVEAGFLSLLTGNNLIVTLPGVSKREKSYSWECEKLFRTGTIPGMFGIGYDIDKYDVSFNDLISASSLIISSSIQEGFGYLYLNSMNWGKPLIARDLDILKNFKSSFNNYPSLFYNTILVNLSQDTREALYKNYSKKINHLDEHITKEDSNVLLDEFDRLLSDNPIDFSYLSFDVQRSVLEHIKMDNQYKNECIKLNEPIIEKIDAFINLDTKPNHSILKENWSYESYGEKSDFLINSFKDLMNINNKNIKESTISGNLQAYFTDKQYLRLLYDE